MLRHAMMFAPLLAIGLFLQPVSAAECRIPQAAGALQQAVLAAVNDARGARGLATLRPDDRLHRAAQDLACDNAGVARMGHQSSDGRTMAERASDQGYDWRTLAENVALGQTGAAEVVADWMDSPPHRKNILNRSISDAGVGIALQADGQVHWVLDLGQPR